MMSREKKVPKRRVSANVGIEIGLAPWAVSGRSRETDRFPPAYYHLYSTFLLLRA